MKIGNLHIICCHVIHFQWLPHRLTPRNHPGIYHWLWYSFGWRAPINNCKPAKTPLLERIIDHVSVSF